MVMVYINVDQGQGLSLVLGIYYGWMNSKEIYDVWQNKNRRQWVSSDLL